MRVFDRRLVCDGCEGILIEIDDFADALGTTDVIDIRDEGPASRVCPGCTMPMRACQLKVGKLAFDEVLGYCPYDGIWFGDGALANVLARFERHHHRGGGSNPQNSIASVYVMLSQKRSRPRPPPVPITAYRHRHLSCPVCDGGLSLRIDRWHCTHCAGTFVENASLESMVAEMRGTPWQMPEPSGDAGSLACPVCIDPMRVQPFAGVTVDRCGEHGVWFDALQLGTALHHASGIRERRGVAAWFRRFLG